MPRFDVTHTKAGVNTANTTMWTLRTPSTTRLLLLELALTVATAPTTGPTFRLGRTTAVGTSSATVTPQTQGSVTAAAGTLLDTAWSANPTLAATDMRNYAVANSIGSGVVWTWYDRPMEIAPSASIHVTNAAATGTTLGSLTIYAVFDE